MPSTLLGKKAPAFAVNNQNEEKRKLGDYADQWLVLYFYPKDNTPGCTVEAKEFTDALSKFKKAGATVVGVSPDTEKKHCNFIEKQGLTIELLADPEQKMLEKYKVWQLKKNYGREYMGVVRSTFLIDPKGKVVKVWDKVRVKGHVAEVLETLQELSK
ncbi:MAG: thioredoxin-dependent thiol peroxidase [Fibrobacterales bacterium]